MTEKENNKIMEALIASFPNNISDALAISEKTSLNNTYDKIDNVLICGMGGSGIGGKIVASWLAPLIDVPINFCQDYTIPNYINERTLVIASSNSGNTEETLIATEAARQKGSQIIGISSGGQLKTFCTERNYECIVVPGGNPPRTTLAYSLVILTHIFVQLGLAPAELMNEFTNAQQLLASKAAEIQEEARNLANFIQGKELIIYSEAKDEGIAIRARQQFNENSKVLCNHHTIPEMNHNELVGWYGGTDRYAVLFLDTNDWHSQNTKRLAFSTEVIQSKTNAIKVLKAKGETRITKALYLINIIDWASLYAAEKNNIDSINIGVIDDLKASLQR